MLNELIFIISTIFLVVASLLMYKLGKEALIAFTSLLTVMLNLFVTKQIVLFGWEATASDTLGIGIACSLLFLQESSGRDSAKKVVMVSFGCALVYTVLSLLHIVYIPSIHDTSSIHFTALLTPAPRLILASLTCYLIVQYCDIHLYTMLKQKTSLSQFARMTLSIAITQCLDTILFSFLGLYGLNEGFLALAVLAQLACVSYAIKLISLALAMSTHTFYKKIYQSISKTNHII